MSVAVVIPTYNEADNIAAVLTQVRTAMPDAHILVVDDRSPDGTADIARDLTAQLGNLEVIDAGSKTGLGAAYRTGFRRSLELGATVCVQLDADLSHDPSVIPALVGTVDLGVDLAIGSRYIPGGRTEDWPWQRRFLSRWGNRYAAGVLGLAINDATSGFRAYRADVLRGMDFESVESDGYGFQVEMTHRLIRAHGSVVELPIVFRDRVAGESKLDKSIIGEAFMLVGRLWFDDRSGRRSRRRAGG